MRASGQDSRFVQDCPVARSSWSPPQAQIIPPPVQFTPEKSCQAGGRWDRAFPGRFFLHLRQIGVKLRVMSDLSPPSRLRRVSFAAQMRALGEGDLPPWVMARDVIYRHVRTIRA